MTINSLKLKTIVHIRSSKRTTCNTYIGTHMFLLLTRFIFTVRILFKFFMRFRSVSNEFKLFMNIISNNCIMYYFSFTVVKLPL